MYIVYIAAYVYNVYIYRFSFLASLAAHNDGHDLILNEGKHAIKEAWHQLIYSLFCRALGNDQKERHNVTNELI